MTLSILCFIFLFLCSFSSLVSSFSIFQVPTTGERISLGHLSTRVQRSALKHGVFAFSSAHNALLGPANFSIRLDELSNHRTVRNHPSLQITINGKPVSTRIPGLRIATHQSTGHTVVMKSNNDIVTVWGKNIHLHPVKPGIFINLPLRSTDTVHTKSTEKIIKNDMNLQKKQVEEIIETTERQERTCSASNRFVVEVSVSFGYSLCDLFGSVYSAAIGGIQALFDDANVIFRRDTCVEVALVNLEGYCRGRDGSDPYGSLGSTPEQILDNFRNFFSTNRNDVQRDIAYIFTGADEGSNVAGFADTPGSCDPMRAYGWVEQANPNVFTHEVGHNLNCEHIGSGIMLETLDTTQLFFAQDSANTIRDYIQNNGARFRSSTCITTGAPSCADSCPTRCSSNQNCVAAVNPGSGFVSCKQALTEVYCVTATDLGFGESNIFYQQTACPTTHQFISVPFDASDPTILCCEESTDTLTQLTADRSQTLLGTYTFNGVAYPNTIFSSSSSIATASDISSTTLLNTQASETCGQPSTTTSSPSVTPSISAPVADSTPTASSSISSSPASSVPPITVSPRASSTASASVPPITVSPLPPSSTPTMSIAPTVSTTNTATTTATPTPSTSLVTLPANCGEGFTDTRALLCGQSLRKEMKIRRVGTVVVAFYTEFGRYMYRVRGFKGARIRNLKIRIFADTLTNEVTESKSFNKKFPLRVTGLYQTKINTMKVRTGKMNCCGNNVAMVSIDVTICNKPKASSKRIKCGEIKKIYGLKIKCGFICTKRGDRFGLPMGDERRCTRCT